MIDIDLLRSLPLFARLKPAALELLARRSWARKFAANDVIFLAGSVPSALLVVTSGLVRVVRGHGGSQVLVHVEGPGGALGEVPLFSGGSYPATSIAAEPTTCLVVGLDAIRAVVAKDPAVAFLFLERLADRLRAVVSQLDRLAVQSVETRLAHHLLTLSARSGPLNPFLLGPTQTIVAEELGTVREVLVRTLRRFRERGAIVAVGRGYYRILDQELLKAVAAG